MKRIVYILSTLCVLMWSSSGLASPVTFNLADPPETYVKLTSVETGTAVNFFQQKIVGEHTSLDVNINDEFPTMSSLTLDDGESSRIAFFDFIADSPPPSSDTYGYISGGIGRFTIEANLSFISPRLDIKLTGQGGWGTVTYNLWHGFINDGLTGEALHWDSNRFETTLPDGNKIRIDLEDGCTIDNGAKITVHATITNLGDVTAAVVPLPPAVLLFGTGLIGAAWIKRLIKAGGKK